MDLQSLGAGPTVYRTFESHAAHGLTLGRVALAQRDQYRIFTEAGERPAEASGTLRHRTPDRAGMPVAGDWVAARITGDLAIVEAVLPRHTLFSRRAPGGREEQQPIAANIDLVFLVCGLDGDFNPRRLERYLTLAYESGAEAVVVLNKSDLCGDLPTRMAEAGRVARGIPVIAATTRCAGGIDELAVFLAPGRTVALLGSSGAGKSTIANQLLGEERQRTNEVRESDSRGRHTTTHRELLPLPAGGALIDTPGMRELQLWAGQESVEEVFDEISAIAAMCRFRDCSHSGEPGCAVEAAIRDGKIADGRWQSYRKLTAEAQRHERLTDLLAAQEAKKKLKVLMRNAREIMKHKRR